MKNILLIACILVSAFLFVAFNSSDQSKQQSSDYIVVKVLQQDNFEYEVKQKLQQGWKLTGGVTTWGNWYLQAMYK